MQSKLEEALASKEESEESATRLAGELASAKEESAATIAGLATDLRIAKEESAATIARLREELEKERSRGSGEAQGYRAEGTVPDTPPTPPVIDSDSAEAEAPLPPPPPTPSSDEWNKSAAAAIAAEITTPYEIPAGKPKKKGWFRRGAPLQRGASSTF